MLFHTDASIGRLGFIFGKARVCSSSTAQNTEGYPIISPIERNMGVLLGTHDVIYLRARVGSTRTGDSQCGQAVHDTFALHGAPGTDFDFYVRCGAAPTPTQYTQRGYSSDSQEFVHLDPSSCPCGPNQYWYIVINSYSGAGAFTFVQHKHYASEHRGVSPAVVQCQATQQKLNEYRDEIAKGHKFYFGALEGSQWWDSITLHNNAAGEGAGIRIHCTAGDANAEQCGPDAINLYDDGISSWNYQATTLAHEMGHGVSCVYDEYDISRTTADYYCQHSIMAAHDITNHNLCYCITPACNDGEGNHWKDPVPWDAGSHGGFGFNMGPAWTWLQNRRPFDVNSTPDNYDYRDFDFNGLYGVVTCPDC